MMIPILKDYYAAGYLQDPKPKAIPPYLPNVNLAMRRKLHEEIGGYDEACEAGEDADFCVRAARAGWAQFFDPAACAFHEPRSNLLALVRQWLWYARGGSHFFFKQQRKRLEIYLDLELVPKMHRYRLVLATRWFPVPAMLFISAFSLVHLIALLGFLALSISIWVPALLLLISSLIFTIYLYLRSPLRRLSLKELLLYAGIAYLINWTCIIGSCTAGLKKRRIFLYPGI